ncbi:MAG: glycoside hydrolase family 97 catalytic domain-containing protein [Bacteroidales bacterium]
MSNRTAPYVIAILFFMNSVLLLSQPVEIISPDGNIRVKVGLSQNGSLTYSVTANNQLIIKPSQLGLRLTSTDFSDSLTMVRIGESKRVSDQYSMLTGKRKNCSYRGYEQMVEVANRHNQHLQVIFRVSNDGVAYRYYLPASTNDTVRIEKEHTSFHLPSDARAWLHPHADARTGWNSTQPSYEENYYIDIPVGTPAPQQAGWSFPALFYANQHWLLITETNVRENYCGSRLSALSPDGEYFIAFPQPLETTNDQAPVYPTSSRPLFSPWRLIIVGSTLGTIVESTLVTDLADPAITSDVSFVKPGQAAWSWVLLKDDSTIFPVQKEFIDYAARMHWRYCLIDAYWDKQIGYEKIQQLVDYARQKKVGILLWYNSAGQWNTAPLTPRDLMYDPQTRRREFEKISKMGVAGVKIDFFGGDGQSMMAYYHEILKDALSYKLLVNFHGATITRGWNRTFPNLMTMEAVKGFEFVTFEQHNADQQPVHCTVLPFTRNAIGPMDFTPVAFSEVPNIRRQTSNAFELALSILFQSGIQHFAEIPRGMAAQPAYVQQFMSSIPEVWDDIKFIDGYPGKYAILARKGNGKWYIAGINAQNKEQSVFVNLKDLDPRATEVSVITDGQDHRSYYQFNTRQPNIELKIKPHGGFVAVVAPY